MKPTLLQLRARHNITMIRTAQVSGLKPAIVWAAFLNKGVSRSQAERVLIAFNLLTGQRYTLNDIEVKIQQA